MVAPGPGRSQVRAGEVSESLAFLVDGALASIVRVRGSMAERTASRTLRFLLPGVACRTVVCWVGQIDEADPVAKVAARLAREGRGQCHVVLGLDTTVSERCRACFRYAAQPPLTPELIALANQRLALLYRGESRTVVLPGNPLHELRRYVRHHKVDLVVMGEQASRIERECGERLVDEPPCAVMLIVPPRSAKGREAPAPAPTSP